jgi:hypothetical protein
MSEGKYTCVSSREVEPEQKWYSFPEDMEEITQLEVITKDGNRIVPYIKIVGNRFRLDDSIREGKLRLEYRGTE